MIYGKQSFWTPGIAGNTVKLPVTPGQIPGRNQGDYVNGSGMAIFVSSQPLSQISQEPAYQLVSAAIAQAWNGAAPNFIIWPDEIVFVKDGKLPAGGNLFYEKAFRIIESLGVPSYFGFYFFPFDNFENPIFFTDRDSLIQQRNTLTKVQSLYNRSSSAVPSGTTVADVIENTVTTAPPPQSANKNTIWLFLIGGAALLFFSGSQKKPRVSGTKRRKTAKVQAIASAEPGEEMSETNETIGEPAPKEVIEGAKVSGAPKTRTLQKVMKNQNDAA